jgi:vesicle coat complex subunit
MEVKINSDISSNSIILNYKNNNPHFSFEYSSNDYLIVFHSGNRTSFFKNNKQFALMKRKSISGWSGSEFQIRADDDIYIVLLIILICSVLITKHNEPDGDSDFTIDLGNLGKELQPLDEDWQPKVL